MNRLSRMTSKVYGVSNIDIDDPDEIENIRELVTQGTPVLLIDDDDVQDDEILDEFNIDADDIIWA